MIVINDNDCSNPDDESNDNKTKIKEWITKITKVLLAYVVIKALVTEITKLSIITIITVIIIIIIIIIIWESPRPGNTRLMSSGHSLISWGEGSSLALVGNPSRDRVSIKILVSRHLKPNPQLLWMSYV